MFLSIFDIFKIGIGPSSSHTIGPMVAATRFLKKLRKNPKNIVKLQASLHGSLAFTGHGHATDKAVILGLGGMNIENYDFEQATELLATIKRDKCVLLEGVGRLAFDPDKDLIFDYEKILTGHANGMLIMGMDERNTPLLTETYYSIGGGFVVTEAEFEAGDTQKDVSPVPYPFANATEMIEMSEHTGLSIAEMKRINENVFHPPHELSTGIQKIWATMNSCITRGLETDGILPGGLNVKRRAKQIHNMLKKESTLNRTDPHIINDWISVYAMAVNEENAAGGRIVTAPTNGAAGVIPAVLRYWLDHTQNATQDKIDIFLLVAAAIGGIIKENASISGAECGCQAEIGSAAAMAAAGLCAVMGGTSAQIENAAEIALEHHLGMTCDPVKGLVQVPCIERNGIGAIKAVSAASLALRGDGSHVIPLDNCIETMHQTGKDMHTRYKETALGGLAVNVPNC